MSDTTDTTPDALEDGAAGAARLPVLAGRHHAQLYVDLRGEARLAWLPAGVATASGGVDLWLHDALLHALHVQPAAAPLAVLLGAAVNGASALVTTWVLNRKNKAQGWQGKPVCWGSVVAGAALTLFGIQPVIDLGYVAAVAAGTGAWHKHRWLTRRALRQALRRHPGAAALAADTQTRIAQLRAARALPPGSAAELADVVDAGEGLGAVVDPGELTEADLAELEARWRRGVTKHLPGTTLRHLRVASDGRVIGVVDGGDAGVTLEAANAKRGEIVAALRLALPDADGVGGQDLLFDQPGGVGLVRGQLRVQIIRLSAATSRSARAGAELVSAPGNPYSVRVGGYVDDGTPGYLDLADYTGAHSVAIVAGTGLGKSSLVDLIAYRARQLGFCILYVDPTDGTSSPIMSQHATWAALGADRAMPALALVQQMAADRRAWMTLHRTAGLETIEPNMLAPCAPTGSHPNPDCPCGHVTPPPVMVIVEECDLIFGENLPNSAVKQAVPWGKLAKAIRKLCMSIVAITQIQDIKAFGGDELLRSSLTTRNFMAGHISTNQGGQLIPGLPYSPKLIRRQHGRMLMCGHAARQMELMADWMPRRVRAADLDYVGPFAEDLFEALAPAPVWPMDAAAAARLLPEVDPDVLAPGEAQAQARFAQIMAGAADPAPALPAAVEGALIPPRMAVTTTRLGTAPVTVACPAPVGNELAELEALWSTPSIGAGSGGFGGAVLAAVAGLAEGDWVTVGELAVRMGRITADADTQDRAKAAGALGAELAAQGRVATTRRSAGMSVRVADLRTALTR